MDSLYLGPDWIPRRSCQGFLNLKVTHYGNLTHERVAGSSSGHPPNANAVALVLRPW